MTSVTETVAEQVGRCLVALGLRRVFGVVGSGNFVVTDAMVRAGAEYVAARHEAAALGMADGYGRASGEVAVCSVHQGPGFVNTLTALTEAAKSRVPLLVVAGTTTAGMTRSNFYVDQAALAREAGAATETVHHAANAVSDTVRAVQRARHEQRPVVLNLPLDVQASVVPVCRLPDSRQTVQATLPSPAVVAALAERLRAARRPVLLAGRGAWRSGARTALQQLAEEAGAALATTAVAKGMFCGHPRDLGVSGGFSSATTTDVLASADVVIGFGCSFTSWTIRHGTLFGAATWVAQVDADPSRAPVSPVVDLLAAGDAAMTAGALLERLRADPGKPVSEWQSHVPVPEDTRWPGTAGNADTDVLHPAALTAELEQRLPAERTVVVDGGHFIGWPATGLSVPDPHGFLFSSAGFQSIGLGMGIAIGAALGRPERTTVLAVGDGGFLMSVADLETLVRERLPVLVVVYDDEAYGAEVHHFADHGSGMPLVRFPGSDIAAVARGFGARGETVRRVHELDAVGSWLAERDGPLVLAVRIDPQVVGHWAEQDFAGH